MERGRRPSGGRPDRPRQRGPDLRTGPGRIAGRALGGTAGYGSRSRGCVPFSFPTWSEVEVLRTIRCKIGWHQWGQLEADYWSAYHICTYCEKARRLPSEHPPETRDHLDLHL